MIAAIKFLNLDSRNWPRKYFSKLKQLPIIHNFHENVVRTHKVDIVMLQEAGKNKNHIKLGGFTSYFSHTQDDKGTVTLVSNKLQSEEIVDSSIEIPSLVTVKVNYGDSTLLTHNIYSNPKHSNVDIVWKFERVKISCGINGMWPNGSVW